MITLFKTYDSDAWDLHFSLERDGVHNKTVSLECDGFLPKDVTSPWEALVGITKEGNPLHINHLPLPHSVELVSKDGRYTLETLEGVVGEVHLKGNPLSRVVSSIDYFNIDGSLLYTSNYCSDGFVFRKDYYVKGRWVSSVYYNSFGSSVLVHDISSGNLVGSFGRVYSSLSDFYVDYLKGLGDSFIFTEDVLCLGVLEGLSLSKKDYLVLLQKYTNFPEDIRSYLDKVKVIVTDHYSYDIVKSSYKEVEYASLKFPMSYGECSPNDAVIATETDSIFGLEGILEKCPNTHIHILATTLVSSKLETLGRLENVTVYPAATKEKVREVFSKCGLFLDISNGGTVFNANALAVRYNMLRLGVLGVSSGKYITKELCSSRDVTAICNILSLVDGDKGKLDSLIDSQNTLLGYNDSSSFSSVM